MIQNKLGMIQMKTYNKRALTDVAIKAVIKAAKAEGKGRVASDAHGLHLSITKGGAAYWRHRYSFKGKPQSPTALGVYPAVGLAEARKKHEAERDLLAKGLDPGEVKRAAKLELKQATENAKTFEAVAKQWLTEQKSKLD